MTQNIDVPATTQALLAAGIDPEPIMKRDPNARRLLEALCLRYNVAAVYRTK